MKLGLSLSASVLALACCSAAHAQTASTASTSTIAGNGAIEQVVVTAERRTENLMTTPVTASVLSGKDLKNRDMTNVDDLQFIAPNVTVNDLGQGADFDIRGIGKGEHNTQTPVGVVTYRDGASTFPGYITDGALLRYPERRSTSRSAGTFVGQNATGGAVFVTTNDPEIGGGLRRLCSPRNTATTTTKDWKARSIFRLRTLWQFAFRGLAKAGHVSTTSRTAIRRTTAPATNMRVANPATIRAISRQGAGRLSVLWQPTDALTFRSNYDGLIRTLARRPRFRFRTSCRSAPRCSRSVVPTRTTTAIFSTSRRTRHEAHGSRTARDPEDRLCVPGRHHPAIHLGLQFRKRPVAGRSGPDRLRKSSPTIRISAPRTTGRFSIRWTRPFIPKN